MREFKTDALKNTVTIRQLRDYLNWLIKQGHGDVKVIKVLEPSDVNPDIEGERQNYESLFLEAPIYQDLSIEEEPYII